MKKIVILTIFSLSIVRKTAQEQEKTGKNVFTGKFSIFNWEKT